MSYKIDELLMVVGNHRTFYGVIQSVQVPRTAYRNGGGSRAVLRVADETSNGAKAVVLHILDKRPLENGDYPDLQRFHVLRAVHSSVQRDRLDPSVLDVRVFSADCIQVLDPRLLEGDTSPLAGNHRALELAAWVQADPEFLNAAVSQAQLSCTPSASPLAGTPSSMIQLTDSSMSGTPISGTPIPGSSMSGIPLSGTLSSGSAEQNLLEKIPQQLAVFGLDNFDVPRLGLLECNRRYDLVAGMVSAVLKERSVQQRAHAAVALNDDFGCTIRLYVFDSDWMAPFPQFPQFHLLLARKALVSKYFGRLEAKVSSVQDVLLLEPRQAVNFPGRVGALARHAEARREVYKLQLDMQSGLDLEPPITEEATLDEARPGDAVLDPLHSDASERDARLPRPPKGFTLLADLEDGYDRHVYAFVEKVIEKNKLSRTGERQSVVLLADTSCTSFLVRLFRAPGRGKGRAPGWADLRRVRELDIWRVRKMKVETYEKKTTGVVFSDGTILMADPFVLEEMPGDDLASLLIARVRASRQFARALAQSLQPAPALEASALEASALFPRLRLVEQAGVGDVFTVLAQVLDSQKTETGHVLTIADGSWSSAHQFSALVSVPRKNRRLHRLKVGYLVALEDLRCKAEFELQATETTRSTRLTSSQPELRALRRRLAHVRRLHLGVTPDSPFVPGLFVREWTFPPFADPHTQRVEAADGSAGQKTQPAGPAPKPTSR